MTTTTNQNHNRKYGDVLFHVILNRAFGLTLAALKIARTKNALVSIGSMPGSAYISLSSSAFF